MWSFGSRRDRLAVLLALATVIGLALAFVLTKGTQLLMPGPLASAHGAIENCNTCHSKSGNSKLGWLHGLVAGDPLADSKACLGCHKMPDTAFNAHGASDEILRHSTERLIKIAASTPQPPSARAQALAFPTHDIEARGLFCATCHQEHQGVSFDLSKITNEQCRSCHVVKFDSFDGHHPKFEGYPFKRRTQIIYDHAGHFGKHFPEVAKKQPAKRIPDTCSACHDSRKDKRLMAVAPFEQTCSACHLDQIVGKERASGPKGIAFLAVPGLDIATLKKKKAGIGEWPDASEAELTPFMKVMIGRTERGREVIKAIAGLNLQDLSNARDEEIKAVESLAWEIKGLFHALIKGKASDVLGNFDIGGGAKLSASLVTDLTASIPRDVVVSAQQEWLPGLAAEMAGRPEASEQKQSGWVPVTTQSSSEERPAGSAAAKDEADGGKRARTVNELPPMMRAGLRDAGTAVGHDQASGEVRIAGAEGEGGPIVRRWSLPSGTSRSIGAHDKESGEKAAQPDRAPRKKNDVSAEPDASATEAPSKADDAGKEAAKTASPPDGSPPQASATESSPADQSDDLLSPSEEELRAIKAGGSAAPKGAAAESAEKSDDAGAKSDDAAARHPTPKSDAAPPGRAADAETPARRPAEPRAAVSVIGIDSDVDPESWAEYGGWYRQDYAIYYRPTGHKDKFIYSWLFLTGPRAPKGDASPAAAVFDVLTAKEAQGSCTKCHSVDDLEGKGRAVNFSPPSVETKQGRFTSFIHEPHFGIMENRGCLTCHALEKSSPYLKSYEQGNSQSFVSNFAEVKKDLCQTCHATNKARQDCLLCHKYHVNGVVTPIMSTRLPTQ
jgi:hypothetical protein